MAQIVDLHLLVEKQTNLMNKSNELLDEAAKALEEFNNGGCRDWALWNRYIDLYHQSNKLADEARSLGKKV